MPAPATRLRTVETDDMRLRIIESVLDLLDDPTRVGVDHLALVAELVDLPRSEIQGVVGFAGYPDRKSLTRARDNLRQRLTSAAPVDNDPEPAAAVPVGGGCFEAGVVRVRDIAAHPSNYGRELGDLRDLTTSIREHGVRVPVVLERHAGRYRLRDGHRRLAAAQLAKLGRIPAIIHADALAEKEWLLESLDYNLRRQGYSPDDMRRVARQLLDLGVDRRGVASAFGVTAAKLTDLLEGPKEKANKPKRQPTSIGRRTVLHAVQDWRTRRVDVDVVLDELERLLTPTEAS